MFYNSIKSAAEFIYITPENWKIKIKDGLDLLLLVSTWQEINGEWTNKLQYKESIQQIIFNILDECHLNGLKTIFYSKEDPPNFWKFINYAKKCDYIFTSCEEYIEKYKVICCNNNVYALTFCINPKQHNPIGFRHFQKNKDIIFSGSWMKKYPERCQDLSTIFDTVLDFGYNLHIIDRNFGNIKYSYPEKYIPYVLPSVTPNILYKIHKQSNFAINVNSVKFSRTMFANRIYELQACGNVIISNFSIGVNNIHPNIFLYIILRR